MTSACRQCGDTHEEDARLCPRTERPTTDGPCGTRIERYDVQRLLGDGGFGAVYLARHTVLEQPVAIKLLRPEHVTNAATAERFVREARAAAAIGHPGIVRVIDFGTTTNGLPFLVMDFVAGIDLEGVLAREGSLPPARAVAILKQVLDALSAAHAAGVIHRDLKPANVLLAPNDMVKLVDFGISKMRGPSLPPGRSLTRTGTTLGTPQYMAPEQFRSPQSADHRADVYAAAVTLYQTLTGALPFDAESYEGFVVRVCTEEPRPLRSIAPHVPEALARVVHVGLARDPAARWQSASAFAAALDHAMSPESVTPATAAAWPVTQPVQARPRAEQPPAPVNVHPGWHAQVQAQTSTAETTRLPPRRRSPVLLVALALGAICVLAVASALVVLWVMRGDATSPPVVAAPVRLAPSPPPPSAPSSPSSGGSSLAPIVPQAPMPGAASPEPTLEAGYGAQRRSAPAPSATPPVASAAAATLSDDADGVDVDVTLLGELRSHRETVVSGFMRARPAVDRCRVAGAAKRVRIDINMPNGEMFHVAPDIAFEQDANVADCVSRAIHRIGSIPGLDGVHGIATLDVRLAPR